MSILIELLNEARKNEVANVKQTPLEALTKIYKNHPEPQNLFVHFAAIQKFGINPSSDFNTPLGFYSYPLDYVLESNMKVPYALNQPYIFVFEAQNYWDLSGPLDKQIISNLMESCEFYGLRPDYELEHAQSNTEAYLVIQNVYLKSAGYGKSSKLKKNPKILFRQILKRANISGVVDRGTGTIHLNEPTQGLFFDVSKLKLIEMVRNRGNIKQEIPDNKTVKSQIEASEYIKSIINLRKKRDINAERGVFFASPPSYGDVLRFVEYNASVGGGRIQFLEKYIAQFGRASLQYATQILNSRFLRGERAIKNSKDKTLWMEYVKRFPEAR